MGRMNSVIIYNIKMFGMRKYKYSLKENGVMVFKENLFKK